MSLNEYFVEIESYEFGAQFSVFSGFRLVLSDMDENETLQNLVCTLRSDSDNSRLLRDRLLYLLDTPPLENKLAYDGSLTSYLYCLWRVDLDYGYGASKEILQTPDLWWSAKLALLVRKEYLSEQISNSLELQSDKGDPLSYALTVSQFPLLILLGHYAYDVNASETSPHKARRFVWRHVPFERARNQSVSLRVSCGQLDDQYDSNPTQDFELTLA